MRRVLVVLALLATGCGVWPWTEVECNEVELGGLRCEQVVNLARPQISGLDGIVRLEVSPGVPCPIDLPVSCLAVEAGRVATVYAELADGRLFGVAVTRHDDGSIGAGPLVDLGRVP
ncbi:MAG TPA: hypothetical protein VHR55_00840 [Candidatus Limnocylindria bacterium]|nr:hypothetical protein [Candidatus Limnocylindria bacterium]